MTDQGLEASRAPCHPAKEESRSRLVFTLWVVNDLWGHENYSEVKDSIKKQYRLENIRVPLMFYEWCTCAHEWVWVCVCTGL